MLWLQLLISFAIWIVLGAQVARLGPRLRPAMNGMSKGLRAAAGAALLLLSCAFILAGFLISFPKGIGSTLTPVQWLAATALGGGFATLQGLAVAVMLSLVLDGVTNQDPASSANQEPGGKNPS